MKHFSHPHDLHVTLASPQNENQPCFGCNLPLLGTCYSCSACNFYLHKLCFELPQSAQFVCVHPEHTLGLLHPPYVHGPCHICEEPCNGFTYNCSICNYNVHANCANLIDPNETKNDRDLYIAVFLAKKIGNMKSMGNTNAEKNDKQVQEELARIKKMEMENELSRRRQNMMMQQIKRASDSIDFMGQIGSSSKYTYRYY